MAPDCVGLLRCGLRAWAARQRSDRQNSERSVQEQVFPILFVWKYNVSHPHSQDSLSSRATTLCLSFIHTFYAYPTMGVTPWNDTTCGFLCGWLLLDLQLPKPVYWTARSLSLAKKVAADRSLISPGASGVGYQYAATLVWDFLGLVRLKNSTAAPTFFLQRTWASSSSGRANYC